MIGLVRADEVAPSADTLAGAATKLDSFDANVVLVAAPSTY